MKKDKLSVKYYSDINTGLPDCIVYNENKTRIVYREIYFGYSQQGVIKLFCLNGKHVVTVTLFDIDVSAPGLNTT